MEHQARNNKVLLYIRRTRSYFYTREVDTPDNGVIENNHVRDTRNRLEMWPLVTGRSFESIRTQIANIAFRHNAKCKPDLIYNYSYRKLPNDEKLWILPIDEDDLIDHQSLRAIRSISCSSKTAVWRTTVAEYNKVRLSGIKNVPSNCYAVKSNAVSNFDVIDKHMFFRKTEFDRALNTGLISGMRIETPASIGKLWCVKSNEELVDRIRQFINIEIDRVPSQFQKSFSAIQRVFTIR